VYGICISCGDNISWKRLQAVPWTPLCIDCAGGGVEPRRAQPEEADDDEPGTDDEAGDNRIREQVLENLSRDGRVELDELQVECRDGTIHLTGALPDEKSHEILISILSDDLGMEQIEDSTRLDPAPWTDEDEEEADEVVEKTEDEVILQGKDEEEEAYAAYENSESVIPADTLTPEKRE
jgi:RNA polymerase-binding transcription factor DksA